MNFSIMFKVIFMISFLWTMSWTSFAYIFFRRTLQMFHPIVVLVFWLYPYKLSTKIGLQIKMSAILYSILTCCNIQFIHAISNFLYQKFSVNLQLITQNLTCHYEIFTKLSVDYSKSDMSLGSRAHFSKICQKLMGWNFITTNF